MLCAELKTIENFITAGMTQLKAEKRVCIHLQRVFCVISFLVYYKKSRFTEHCFIGSRVISVLNVRSIYLCSYVLFPLNFRV